MSKKHGHQQLAPEAYSMPLPLIISIAVLTVLILYIKLNDQKLAAIPSEALALSPDRITPELTRKVAKEVASWDENPILKHLPPATGRRYIVIGGTGLLGGWIVRHLLQRGESAQNIRILDIRPPTRKDLLTGPAKDVEFVQCDVSDRTSIQAGFEAAWSSDQVANAPLTVFHTAANIRFYERHEALMELSERVNVKGTEFVVEMAKKAGATILVYTSSGSVAIRASKYLLWPWQKEPEFFVQALSDGDDITSKPHSHFFSNYAHSKWKAESLVREADGSYNALGQKFKTGCVRPGNGIYGAGDILVGDFIARKVNPTWIANIIENYIYVENCSLAHLCYEQRLLEQLQGSSNPDIGGQAFIVTDAGPPVSYGDVYTAVTTLTHGDTRFIHLSSTAMLLLSYIVEAVYLARELNISSPSVLLRGLARLLPRIRGDILMLQPSLWGLAMCHILFDDSRARLPASKGGLGYSSPITSIQGICFFVEQYRRIESQGKGLATKAGITLQ